MSWIEKIKQKPQAVKVRIIWTVSIIVVIFLIIVWVISLRFEKNVPKDTSLFKAIGQGIHNVKENYNK